MGGRNGRYWTATYTRNAQPQSPYVAADCGRIWTPIIGRKWSPIMGEDGRVKNGRPYTDGRQQKYTRPRALFFQVFFTS